MSLPVQTSFDYDALPVADETIVRAAAERIKLRVRRVSEDIIAIGQDLIAVKERLEHGLFLPWVASEFEMSERTAQNFISVATRFGKSATVADLSPKVLYALAAPSTPDDVVEKAAEKAAAGGKVTAADVARWKAVAEAAKVEAETVKRNAQDSLTAALSDQEEGFHEERVRLKRELDAAALKLKEAQEAADAARRAADLEAEKKYKGKADKIVEAAMTAKHREFGDLDREVKRREAALEGIKARTAEAEKWAREKAEYNAKIVDQFEEERDLIAVMEGASMQLGIVLAAFDSRYQQQYSESFKGKVAAFLKAFDRVRQSVAECGDGLLELEVIDA